MDARVLITESCPRDCWYCCNKHEGTKESLETCRNRKDLLKYERVTLTGGEPLLYPGYTLEIATYLKDQGAKVYLNTTIWPEWVGEQLIQAFTGITYSLHAPFSPDDNDMLEQFMSDANGHGNRHRLNIDPDIVDTLMIDTSVFHRIQIFEIQDSCPVPEDVLLLLDEKCRGCVVEAQKEVKGC